MSSNKTLVLVTGGTGFLGGHCILALSKAGYAVRTTVRSLKKKDELIETLKRGGLVLTEDLTFVEADLTSDAGWNEAVENCKFVLHTASPVPVQTPKNDDEIIRPAVDGTLRVLKAAKDKGVLRVVVTSSFAAVGYGHKNPSSGDIYTEKDWSDSSNKSLTAYIRSKILAERAAWDYINTEGKPMELVAINPTAIFGPLLGSDLSAAHQILKQLIDGSIPALPNMKLRIIDVRDVADLHIRAMANPVAAGERFLALSGTMAMVDIAKLIREKFGEDASKVPTRTLPDFVIRFAALFSWKAAQTVSFLGPKKDASNEKAKTLLGWSPVSKEEAILAAASSVIELSKKSKEA